MTNIMNFVPHCRMLFYFSRMMADWLSLRACHEKSKWYIRLSHLTHTAYSVIKIRLTPKMWYSMVIHVIHKCELPPKQPAQPRC